MAVVCGMNSTSSNIFAYLTQHLYNRGIDLSTIKIESLWYKKTTFYFERFKFEVLDE